MMNQRNEHQEQCAVIDWVRRNEQREPRLSLLFAIPNGAKLPYTKTASGVRYSPEAARLKSEGLRPGTPDLFLPCPIHGVSGLFIEMKSENGVVRPEQKEMHQRLREQGYQVSVCRGAMEAIKVISEYLDLDRQLGLVNA